MSRGVGGSARIVLQDKKKANRLGKAVGSLFCMMGEGTAG